MPRASQEQMRAHRSRVVEVAAALLREHGVAGVTIDGVTERAGLTRGGFYKWFGSRAALVAEALDLAVRERRAAVAEAVAEHGPQAHDLLADWYLSPEHRDDPASGCAVAALVGEAAVDGSLREGFGAAVDDLLAAVGVGGGSGEGPGGVDDDTLAAVALMVGAVELSRATAGSPLSDRFLAAARERLRAQG